MGNYGCSTRRRIFSAPSKHLTLTPCVIVVNRVAVLVDIVAVAAGIAVILATLDHCAGNAAQNCTNHGPGDGIHARYNRAHDRTGRTANGGTCCDATTLVVTIPFDSLKHDLATAELLDDPDDGRITAAEARRLACIAQIIPAVLGGQSQPLDLGRARRLFTSGQRKSLLIRDRTCRAQGCDIPGTWAEAHHWIPWVQGGKTNLDDGVLLCSHHHHRAHDPTYDTERLTNGDVRFHRRR